MIIVGVAYPAGSWCYNFANLVEENNRYNRPACCWGLDCISCAGQVATWICTCSCVAPEGRYLVRPVPGL
jgi:hypothetical protein